MLLRRNKLVNHNIFLWELKSDLFRLDKNHGKRLFYERMTRSGLSGLFGLFSLAYGNYFFGSDDADYAVFTL